MNKSFPVRLAGNHPLSGLTGYASRLSELKNVFRVELDLDQPGQSCYARGDQLEPISKAELRARIVTRCRKIVRECTQSIDDFSSWNENHRPAGVDPLDVQSFVESRNDALRVLAEFGESP